jgi:hypothetical protein
MIAMTCSAVIDSAPLFGISWRQSGQARQQHKDYEDDQFRAIMKRDDGHEIIQAQVNNLRERLASAHWCEKVHVPNCPGIGGVVCHCPPAGSARALMAVPEEPKRMPIVRLDAIEE